MELPVTAESSRVIFKPFDPLDLLQSFADLGGKRIGSLLGISQEHVGILLVEHRVVQVRIAATHGALHEDDLLGLPHLDDGHAPDGTAFDLLRRGIHDVVGADDQDDVEVFHIRVHLVHLQDPLVGHACLSQQHVHLAWHSSSNGVDAELEVNFVLAQEGSDLTHGGLSTSHGHSVAGDDQDLSAVGQELSDGWDARLGMLLGASVGTFGDRSVVQASEKDIDDVSVHGVAHDLGEDSSAESDQGANDGEDSALEEEALGNQGPARV
mmetsp:Transcript_5897/g.8395  ORF Transcript_5897/g.8395 Transcript_5897/m.8395 type:complete len:267 (-) Transcript_5897:6-806(-)